MFVSNLFFTFTFEMFSLLENERVINTVATLNNNQKLPVIGIGTFQIRGRSTIHNVLDAALRSGYRSIDTAAVYGNEVDIGVALKQLLPKYNLKRGDIFITTKLAPHDHGDERKVTQAVQTSLQNLNTPYIDLYLIHWPGTSGISMFDGKNASARNNTWNTLVKLYDNGNGVLRSIGVSNYTDKHLIQLLQSSSVIPAVNQVEFHPHWQQSKEFHKICRDNKILLQAYSSLGGSGNKSLLKDQVIVKIAEKYRLTPAQVLLRWGLQRGYAIIPKSVTPRNIELNAALDVVLADTDVNAINNIGAKRKYAWNPETIP